MSSVLNLLRIKGSTIMFLVMGSLVGALFFKAVAKDPGYILLAHGKHTFETSLLVGVLVVLLVSFVGYWLVVIGRRLISLQWFRSNHSRLTTDGLIALAQGDWANAEKLLARAARGNDVPLINYLTAAQAAHEQGKSDERDQYLRLAHESTKGADAAVSLTKARLQYQSGHWEECLATLMKLSREPKSPSYPYVVKMLSKVYLELEDWESLRELLPALKKHKVVSVEEFGRLAQACYEGKLKRAVRGDDDEEKRRHLKEAWHQIPKKFHTEPSLVRIYADALVAVNAAVDAERVITDLLRKNWDDGLVQVYGRITGGDVEKQFLWCENWLKERPNNPMLLLTMGRLSLQRKDWERARGYFEASLRSRKSAQAYGELGRLLSHLGEHQASNEHFQSGLALIAERLPDLPMPNVTPSATADIAADPS
ncbi:heme biosynthesis protein HemY [Ketobacter sp.]|uniref:heme biosynthesis protein HemY n=1 Tax=Ketobacter sp. TaxID=2083498 RepID=UPI000F1AA150|nr:heme biosynthesis HemY N-terminal domain-containing protein [Ketobacter sp.]RLU00710.1 MAG: heme biosynthesis protein HemY [Ketobacter sp.]